MNEKELRKEEEQEKFTELKHFYDTTVNLFATDRPEIIPEELKGYFFELTSIGTLNNKKENNLSFSQALYLLKDEKRVCRSGWNGKGMYIFLLDKHDLPYVKGSIVDFDKYKTDPFIVMKTADNKLVPWLASQTDLLADDWMNIAEQDTYFEEEEG